MSLRFQADQPVVGAAALHAGRSQKVNQRGARIVAQTERRIRKPLRQDASCVGRGDGEPPRKPSENRVGLKRDVRGESANRRQSGVSRLVLFVPTAERGNDSTGVGGHRRPLSMSARTCSAVSGSASVAVNRRPCGPRSNRVRDGTLTSR